MIRLTRLNGEVIYLSFLQIQFMESIPETKIRMVNGDYYLVKDTVESVVQQVNELLANCGSLAVEKRR